MLFWDVPQLRLVATDVSGQLIDSIFRDQEVLRRRWLATVLHYVMDEKGEYLTATKTAFVSTQRRKGKGKGKAIPLQAWTNPEGSRRLRLPDFKPISTRIW